MIKEIKIENIAEKSTYKKSSKLIPSKINFIFGNNGSGKSTLARYIADEVNKGSPHIKIEEKKHEVLIYNKQFVEQNFENHSEIKGIFSLGKKTLEKQRKIKELEKNIEKYLLNIKKAELSYESKSSNNKNKKMQIQQQFLKFHKDVDNEITKAKTVATKSEIIKKYSNNKNAKNSVFIGWKKMYEDIMNQVNDWTYDFFHSIELLEVLENEKSDLPAKEITKKVSLNIISRNEEFDKEYEINVLNLNIFVNKYKSYFDNIVFTLKSILKNRIPIIDNFKNLDKLVKELNIIYSQNYNSLKQKLDNMKLKVNLKSLVETIKKINTLLNQYNQTILSHNSYLAKKPKDKDTNKLVFLNYSFLNHKKDIENHIEKFTAINESFKKINNEFKRKIVENKIKIIQDELKISNVFQSIEKSPIVEKINSLLQTYGFDDFRLIESKTNIGFYKIVRADDEDAKKTLSEGEYSFLTFLYFYFSVYDNSNSSSNKKRKIIIIDDPISSLDSGSISIVATLVKGIITDCLDPTNKTTLTQLFVLTHNTYFHRHVTQKRLLSNDDTRFFMVKKRKGSSQIISLKSNPIMSQYQHLWNELNSELNELTVRSQANLMRRILEYFFEDIMCISIEKYIKELDTDNKVIFKDLRTFLNEGSHTPVEESVLIYTSEKEDRYLNIFRKIFEITGHIDHFNKMRGYKVETMSD